MAAKARPKKADKVNFKDASESALKRVGTVSGSTPERYYADGSTIPDSHTDLPVYVSDNGVFFLPECGDPGFAMTHPTWDALVEAVDKVRKDKE